MRRLRSIAIDVRPLREVPAYRNLWLGQTVSMLGSSIGAVAVPYQLYHLTGSTLLLGLLGLCQLVPLLVAPLAGGAVADAVDRRRLILCSELALVVVSGLLLANALAAHPQVWALFVLEAFATLFGGFAWPALRSAIPRLVPADQVMAAASLQSLQGNLSQVGGPALGGVLIAAVGVSGAYAIDLATYASSLLAILALPAILPLEGSERPSLRTIAEGFRFVRGQKPLLGIFLLDSNAMVFGMPKALFPAVAAHRLGGGASTLGLLYAAPYLGALCATLLVSGWLRRVRRMGVGVAVAAAGWGAAIVVFGFSTALWAALAALVVAGAADMVSAVLRSTMVIDITPDHMRGRVAGIELMQVASTPALGDLEAGTVASATSLRLSIVSGGVACVAGTLLVALLVPALLRYDSARTRAAHRADPAPGLDPAPGAGPPADAAEPTVRPA